MKYALGIKIGAKREGLMINFKRPLSITVKILSIVGMVLCLSGIAGSWIVNASLKSGISKSLSRIENVFNVSEKGLRRVDSSVVDIQSKIDEKSHGIINGGDETVINKRARTFIETIAASEIETKIESAKDTMDQVYETVALVNQVLETVNRMLFISIPTLPTDELLAVQNRLSEVRTAVQDIERIPTDIESDATQNILSLLTPQVVKINSAVEKIRTSISDFQYSVNTVNKATSKYKTNLSRWINLASLIVSALLCWLILAQMCLFIHSRVEAVSESD